MGTYLMMLYVSLEQEKAVKNLFNSKGWGFKKPDLSMTTDKLGPTYTSIDDNESESEGETTSKGRTRSRPATREASKRTPAVKIIKQSPKSEKKTSKVRVQLRKGGKKSTENAEFQEILEEAELITASINPADDEGEGEEIEPFTVKVERDGNMGEDSDYEGEDGESNDEDMDDDFDDVTPSTSYLEAGAESTDISQETADTPKPAKRRKVTTKARERPTLPPVDMDDLEAMGDLSPIKPKLSRRKRKYDLGQLVNACHAVRTEKMAIRKAARIYCVPEATVRNTLDRFKEDECLSIDKIPKHGPASLLTKDEENDIAGYLNTMSEIGYDFYIRQINRMATDYAVVLGKRSHSERTLSTEWFHNFNSRHTEIRINKKLKLAEVREKANSEDVIGPYYAKLKGIIETCDLTERPDSIYVVDEIIFPMEKDDNETTIKTSENVATDEKEEKEKNISIIGCGNASGSLVPPYFVLPGKRWHDRYLESACEGSRGEYSESGKPHAGTIEHFFRDHFTKFVKLGKPNPTTLVLYDGHKLHHPQLTLTDWAEENNVVFFPLPLHMSVITGQDTGCFQPLREAFKGECEAQFKFTNASSLTSYDAARVGSNAYLKAMTQIVLVRFFKSLGIGNINPESADL